MSRQQTYNASTGNQTRARTFAVATYLFASVALSAPAFEAHANASPITEADASTLGPGDYRWDPSLAPDGPTVMVVKLDTQRAFVWRNGKLIGITIIASGKPGYETPDGTFAVLEKEKFHRSNKYDDAPMPYMQRLTWSGLALHGGNPRGYPASHGCIRLPQGFAAALFKENTRGMKVVVTGHAPERGENLMASRQKPHTTAQSDDVQQAEFSSGADQPDRGASAEGTAGDESYQQAAPSQSEDSQGEASRQPPDEGIDPAQTPPDNAPPPPPPPVPFTR